MATIKDVARHVGLSVTTVSRALNNYDDVAETTRERVRAVARTLDYHPNAVARSLQGSQTDTVGLVIPLALHRSYDAFWLEFIGGMVGACAPRGVDVLVSAANPHGDLGDGFERLVRGGRVDGLLVCDIRRADPRIAYLRGQNIPFVAFGRTLEEQDYPFIDVDGTAGVAPRIDWLNSSIWVVPAIVLTSLWGIGNVIVIYLAGLKGVPQPLYEAAEVDGAGWWARFWNVTIPLLSPTIFYNLLTGLIGVFQIFDGPYVLTQGKGGPPLLSGTNILGSSEFYMIKLYRDAFANNLYGKASAEAVLLFVFIVLLTLVVLRTSRSWVYYEGNVVKGV